MRRITFKQYQNMLMDSETTEEEILAYSKIEKGEGAFDWRLVANNELVFMAEEDEELENAMSIGNGIAKWKRKLNFNRRKCLGSKLPVLVAEGDSWFQFPFLIQDTIDHLSQDYLIWSLGSAGDTAHNMLADKGKIEYLDALRKCSPDVRALLLSAAGNDIIGEDPRSKVAALQDILNSYDGTSEVSAHINFTTLEQKLKFLRGVYQETIDTVRGEVGFEKLPIIIHGYDYVIPFQKENDPRNPSYAKNNEWLGEPLDAKGIFDTKLRSDILRRLIDCLYEMLGELAGDSKSTNVYLVDCRNTLTDINEWNDEIHGTSEGFFKIAEKFKTVIESAISRE